jgi:hypothetical protein
MQGSSIRHARMSSAKARASGQMKSNESKVGIHPIASGKILELFYGQ